MSYTMDARELLKLLSSEGIKEILKAMTEEYINQKYRPWRYFEP